jgi:hypothetical protein
MKRNISKKLGITDLRDRRSQLLENGLWPVQELQLERELKP